VNGVQIGEVSASLRVMSGKSDRLPSVPFLRSAAAPFVRPRNQGCMVSRSWAVRISGGLGRSRGSIHEISMTFSLKEAGGYRIGSAAMLNELPWV